MFIEIQWSRNHDTLFKNEKFCNVESLKCPKATQVRDCKLDPKPGIISANRAWPVYTPHTASRSSLQSVKNGLKII